MPITRLSTQAQQVLDAHPQLKLHSVFASAANLRAGDRLIVCTIASISAPHGVEIAPGDLAQLQQLRRERPTEKLVWNTIDRTIISRSHTVSIASAAPLTVFDTTLTVAGTEGISSQLERLLQHLSRNRPPTGFGDDWPLLTQSPRITRAVNSLHECTLDEAVLYWIGRGPGLTPSGDDLLLGIIAALWYAGAINAARITPMRGALETTTRRRTTAISVEYLHYACQGMVIGALREFLNALGTHDPCNVIDTMDRLRRHGHTSGADCLLGAIAALRYLDAR